MKKFDCVELQHKGGQRVAEQLKAMTVAQQAEYWKQRTEQLRERQRRLQAGDSPRAESHDGQRAD
jgi:hypothetical protein